AMNVVHFLVGGAMVLLSAAPAALSWPFIFLSTLIHFGYYAFLLGSYRLGDLSQVYPLSRGSAPLIVALLSPWLVGEHAGASPLMGVALLCLGILSLAFNRLRLSEVFDWRPVSLALANGACIAAYTMADAAGVRQSGSPAGYIGWLFVLEGISMLGITAWVRGRDLLPAMRGCWEQGGLAGAPSPRPSGIVIR